MRIACIRPNKLAVIQNASYVNISEPLALAGALPQAGTMIDLIHNYDAISDPLKSISEENASVKLDSKDLLPPVDRPSKIWAAAANYRRGGQGLEDSQGRGAAQAVSKEETLEMVFLKPPSAIIGPEETIIIPKGAETIFPELELCVVIGKQTRKIPKEQALQAVFGYTIILDVTARGYGSGQNLFATRPVRKGFETFAPIGPWITTADEIPDPSQLTMRLWVNDELVQAAKTDGMINTVPELISYLSEVSTLYPGDLIATGNPDAPDFQRKLADGDRLTAEIEGIGQMNLNVRAEK